MSKRRIFTASFFSCQTSVSSATLIMAASAWRQETAPSDDPIPGLLIRHLVLTDCCSLFRAILRIQPKSTDSCAKLILNQLRDFRHCLHLPSADNTCSLGDVETKHDGSMGILSHFMATGPFEIPPRAKCAKTLRGAQCASRESTTFFLQFRQNARPMLGVTLFFFLFFAMGLFISASLRRRINGLRWP